MKKRKQRVDVACDFCRRRKLGCDNAKPRCASCHSHQKNCTYGSLEVRKAARRGSPGAGELVGQAEQLLESTTRTAATEYPTPRPHETTRNTSPSTQYHGPTSAIFDGDRSEESHNPPNATGTTGALARAQMMAESARQRQLELINLRAGKLDFDGLEVDRGMRLLSIFWSRQHATGSVVYRPSFMRDMACQGRYFSKLLLYAIFFLCTKNCQEKSSQQGAAADVCEAGNTFRRKIEAILYDPDNQILCKSSITTIQALLLFSDALFSWCDETSLSWQYLGIAINMIIDLGLHSEISAFSCARSNTLEELEVSRRVFWAAFAMDKTQSIYQGRPPRLSSTNHSVSLTFLDEYEELEPFDTDVAYGSAGPQTFNLPTYSVSTFQQLCSLSTIADHILCHVYGEKTTFEHPQNSVIGARALQVDLYRWHEALPEHLKLPTAGNGSYKLTPGHPALPHTLCLILEFHALLILLHRPFVSGGHLSSADDTFSIEALRICVEASLDIDQLLRHYKSRWSIKSPPYFLSYATYVSATIHVRILARKSDSAQARLCLQNCLEILVAHQDVCRAPRRALEILTRLCQRLNVDTGESSGAQGSKIANEKDRDYVTSGSATMKPHTGTTSETLAIGQPAPARPGMDPESPASIVAGPMDFTDLEGIYGSMGSSLDDWLPGVSFDLDPLFGFENVGTLERPD